MMSVRSHRKRIQKPNRGPAKVKKGGTRAPTVLIVDDEPRIRTLIARVIQMSYPEYAVEQAGNGIEAAEKLLHSSPQLVVLDLRLPMLGGLELCRLIQRQKWLSETRILVITGYPTPGIYQEVFLHRATEFLPKPFDIKDLTASLRRLLS